MASSTYCSQSRSCMLCRLVIIPLSFHPFFPESIHRTHAGLCCHQTAVILVILVPLCTALTLNAKMLSIHIDLLNAASCCIAQWILLIGSVGPLIVHICASWQDPLSFCRHGRRSSLANLTCQCLAQYGTAVLLGPVVMTHSCKSSAHAELCTMAKDNASPSIFLAASLCLHTCVHMRAQPIRLCLQRTDKTSEQCQHVERAASCQHSFCPLMNFNSCVNK